MKKNERQCEERKKREIILRGKREKGNEGKEARNYGRKKKGK